jgi:hypothetical protein
LKDIHAFRDDTVHYSSSVTNFQNIHKIFPIVASRNFHNHHDEKMFWLMALSLYRTTVDRLERVFSSYFDVFLWTGTLSINWLTFVRLLSWSDACWFIVIETQCLLGMGHLATASPASAVMYISHLR